MGNTAPVAKNDLVLAISLLITFKSVLKFSYIKTHVRILQCYYFHYFERKLRIAYQNFIEFGLIKFIS